ncbi:MAG TPA: TonB-dependent receptor [Thermoanaerobaculaceae bacterium]|nr:TonB-dependent receptor [Thermoanaerobaculaceae bacterium]HRS16822.1 TonB-dependent receptor [Thermoanaerobaculaceae bacterium]
MRKVLLCAVLCLAAGAAVGYALEGRLVDASGRPMVGARIQMMGTRGWMVVGSDGSFRLEPPPAPPFELLVTRADGVAMRPIRVETVPADGVLEIRVEAAREESVTVMGEVPDLELPPAAALTLVGRGDLDQRNPVQLFEVLEGTPGAGKNGDGLAAVPSLRGLAAGRTLLLVDEGRVTAERRAGPSATFLDPASVDEVEIVRGPGSVAYGSDAFGGIIRARTRLAAPGEEPSLRYSLGFGTVDDLRSASVDAATGFAGGGLTVGGSYRELADYESPRGKIVDSGGKVWSGRVGYQRQIGQGLLRVLWRSDLGRDIGKPGSDSNVTRNTYPEDSSHRLSIAFETPGPGAWSRLAVAASWVEYDLVTRKDTLPTATKARQVADADVFAHDYGVRLEAERPLGPARLVLGLDLSGRYGLHAVNDFHDYDLAGEITKRTHEVAIDSARRDDYAAFAGLSGKAGIVDLSGGLRFDRVESRNRGGYFGNDSRSASAFSGFAAAAVPLGSSFSITGQVARGFREPLLSDRYYRGISGRGFITGNPALEAETSKQADLALRWSGEEVQLAAFGYLYRIEDLIERYKSGGNYFFRNRGEAEVKGVELEGSLRLGRTLLVQLAVQSQRGETRADGAPIDGIPAEGAILTLRRAPGQRWWWLARVAAYRRDDREGPTEREVPGYTVFDAGLGYRLSELLEIQLLGRNLLDREYFGSADEKTVLAPGRGVQLSLRGRL